MSKIQIQIFQDWSSKSRQLLKPWRARCVILCGRAGFPTLSKWRNPFSIFFKYFDQKQQNNNSTIIDFGVMFGESTFEVKNGHLRKWSSQDNRRFYIEAINRRWSALLCATGAIRWTCKRSSLNSLKFYLDLKYDF